MNELEREAEALCAAALALCIDYVARREHGGGVDVDLVDSLRLHQLGCASAVKRSIEKRASEQRATAQEEFYEAADGITDDTAAIQANYDRRYQRAQKADAPTTEQEEASE